jgi:hypothetical protein
MWEVLNASVCLHNIIIENERDDTELESEEPYFKQGPLVEPDQQVPTLWPAFLTMRQEILDLIVHDQLQKGLVEHPWSHKGNN